MSRGPGTGTGKGKTRHRKQVARKAAVRKKQRAEKLRAGGKAAAGDIDALFQRAVTLHQKHKPRQAEAAYKKVLDARPDHVDASNNLGLALMERGALDDAVRCFRDVLAIQPGHAQALGNLADALMARGDIKEGDAEEAIQCYERFLDAHGEDPAVLASLAGALASRGRMAEAAARYRLAAEIAPGDPEILVNLGNALQAAGEPEDAVGAYRRALSLDPGSVEAHYNLGLALHDQDRPEDAAASYQRALAIDPGHAMALVNLGQAHQDLGRVADAVDCYRRALAADPADARAWHNLALTKTFEPGDPDLAAMEALRARPALDDGKAMYLDFALAKAWDDAGDHDRAFAFMAGGNALKRKSLGTDVSKAESLVERIVAVFDKPFFEARAGWGSADGRAVFIVGMPRSGTSLAEQILASHSAVMGAGETPHLPRLVGELEGGFPEGAGGLGPDDLRRLGEDYVARLCHAAPDAQRVTDKMPANFLHAGLIHLALPNARIVHCRRDPMDTCLSCFQILFTRGQEFTYGLDDLGRYFRAYARLMDHWRDVLPGRVFDLQYEALVAEPEARIRALLEFSGLEWEDACLAFHETERTVRTASALQVRRPIYKTAVRRWRRYEKHLGPLLKALGPLAGGGG